MVAGSGRAVQVQETRADGGTGWVYLFKSTTLNPAAGKDYVTYTFTLTSGAYKTGNNTTYKRCVGGGAAREPRDIIGGDPDLPDQLTPTGGRRWTGR